MRESVFALEIENGVTRVAEGDGVPCCEDVFPGCWAHELDTASLTYVDCHGNGLSLTVPVG
jgi:hypothetical protein